MSKLLAIARRAESRAPREELAAARSDVTTSVEGDSRGGSAGRQGRGGVLCRLLEGGTVGPGATERAEG